LNGYSHFRAAAAQPISQTWGATVVLVGRCRELRSHLLWLTISEGPCCGGDAKLFRRKLPRGLHRCSRTTRRRRWRSSCAVASLRDTPNDIYVRLRGAATHLRKQNMNHVLQTVSRPPVHC